MEPELRRGDLAVDDRGEVAFVNEFDFAEVKRFYTVANHAAGFVRAWHGHRNERKFVFVAAGAALVCCVRIDDWERPSPDLEVKRFVLSDRKPAVLEIPPGYANGFMTLAPATKLIFFSTSSLEESLGDDVRFPARYWDPWSVEERQRLAELSIIVPARNDAVTLPKTIRDLDRVAAQASIFCEVLIIDDSSEDDTVDVAVKLAERYPALHARVFRRDLPQPSFGGLMRFGMAHASGRYCAVVSADGSDPVDLLPEMLNRMRAGATMVVCSRYIRPEDARRVGLRYRVYQAIYRAGIRFLLGQEATDSTYGFRAFNRIYILALGTSSKRFNIFPEMTFKVMESGGTIEYLAGSPQPVGVGGSEKFKLPNEILGYAVVLVRAGLHRVGMRWF